jgi:cytochrome c peroxidase
MRPIHLLSSMAVLFTSSMLFACATDTSSGEDPISAESASDALSSKTKKCKSRDYSKTMHVRNGEEFRNPAGKHATISTRDGRWLDTNNAFFDALGTNGRACVTCHTPEDGFSISAAGVAERFEESCGTDPIFRTNDGSNNPNADVSTLEARRAAYSLLIERGLIRIQLPIPANAFFKLVAVDDPYGNSTAGGLSLFRRPLASTNLKFNPLIMFDAREPDLASQARNATIGHAQGAAPDAATLQSIVDFESALFTTQVQVRHVGNTSSHGALGSPEALAATPFALNENRTFPGCTATVPPSCNAGPISVATNDVFTLFAAWEDSHKEGRKAVARGEVLFNTKRFVDPAVGPATPVTCSNCHNSANAGTFSGGLTPPAPPFGGFPTVAISAPPFRAGLPLYTLESLPGATSPTGDPIPVGTLVKTSDPGMAMRTGLWRDINRFKTPGLRGLASHAPYFHNGLAPTLEAVVDHYNNQFVIGLTDQEKSDLTAFLRSL